MVEHPLQVFMEQDPQLMEAGATQEEILEEHHSGNCCRGLVCEPATAGFCSIGAENEGHPDPKHRCFGSSQQTQGSSCAADAG